jgi:hypothetical protein
MKSRNPAYMLAACLAVLACLMMAYVISALGLIADEGDRADMVYLMVFACGLVGAAIARLRPQGMAITLFVMAFAQAAIGAIVFIVQLQAESLFTAFKVLALNGFFTAMFIASGWLFLCAARPGNAQLTN